MARHLENLRKRCRLLTLANPKIIKGQKAGWLTAVLHLAPSDLSGHNVCPMAQRVTHAVYGDGDARLSACSLGCLNLAGRGGIAKGGILSARDAVQGRRSNSVQAARIRRTQMYFEARGLFMATLANEIADFVNVARVLGMRPAVRLNGTSDIQWERQEYCGAPSIIAHFPEVQFYDYTKIAKRVTASLPANYHLTLSRSEVNELDARAALSRGANVAAVFAVKRGAPLPASYLGRTVIDGDESDLRFLDARGVVVGLRAKGPAIRDCSGFVVR
jgi:hypothetical protein